MTIIPPAPGEPRRPQGPRDPGDAWVVAETGEKYWGRFGAAGLLAVDAQRGVLLQHRVAWSHFGGTWGLPGGALHQFESAVDGAQREAQEEAGIPEGAVRPRFSRVLDLQIWSYTTVVADVEHPFEPVISDPESVALEWVAVDQVDQRPLHPGFGAAWPALRELLEVRPALILDDAEADLRDRLDGVAVPGEDFGLPGLVWFPEVVVVGDGSDAVVEQARTLPGSQRPLIVVTSDRDLATRVQEAGADVRSVSWFRSLRREESP